MMLVLRLLLYAVCLFLVMLVYASQKQTDAAGTVHAATRLTGKLLAWSIVGVLVMTGLQFLFVD